MRRVFFSRQLAALAVITLMFGSCATKYSSPSEADSATLTAIVPVWFVSVDGERIPGIGFIGEKRVAVSPGTHLVEVKYSDTEHPEVITRDHQHRYGARMEVLPKQVEGAGDISCGSRSQLLLSGWPQRNEMETVRYRIA